MTFQRRSWLVERAAWILLGAILVAALLGVFGGGGPAASTDRVSEDGNLSMQYDRFSRIEAPTRLRVVVTPPVEAGTTLRLWLAREYVEALEIESILPEPSRVEAASDRYVFEFPLTAAGETSTILFRVEPREAWHVEGRLGIDGGSELRFDQFVYP
ncbi:MAG TPA: hypothetical protein VF339_13615 [Gammaproteobacteria bacterium]